MAVTISQYNSTEAHIDAVGINNMTLKLQLLATGASFNATHTALTSVNNSGAFEVSGNGWTAGGVTLGSVTVSTVTTNDASIDAADVNVTASGGSIGPAISGVIYDDVEASDKPLWYIDFDGSLTAGEGANFVVLFNASGIHVATVA